MYILRGIRPGHPQNRYTYIELDMPDVDAWAKYDRFCEHNYYDLEYTLFEVKEVAKGGVLLKD